MPLGLLRFGETDVHGDVLPLAFTVIATCSPGGLLSTAAGTDPPS